MVNGFTEMLSYLNTERERERERERELKKIVDLHSHCSNGVNLHKFNLTNVGEFLSLMCKIGHFFYFTFTNVNALTVT